MITVHEARDVDNTVAPTISETYREEQERLHENPNYGVASIGFAPIVSDLINKLGVTELLDYGAGKGNLAKHLSVDHEVEVKHYDPARPEWAKRPDSAQMVACIDVLEHIEPEYLDEVLDVLWRRARRDQFPIAALQRGRNQVMTDSAVILLAGNGLG